MNDAAMVKVGTNPAKLASIIRFHLSELRARNAHHEFEHLARHLARARIASNIVPATGPVSSGGDSARDFETYSTKHAAPGPPGNRFAARSKGPSKLVFACSLQKAIEPKIRKDVCALVDQGGVEEIIYFCESNLPISKRLNLTDETKARGVELQIFDGNAISEMLSEPDIFWIAQEYLHLPLEIAPAGEIEQGYFEHRNTWQLRDPIAINWSDFSAIKAGLRKATFDDSAHADLSFWLEKMSVFLELPASRDIMRDAMYEIAVANLRGRGDLTPAAGLVKDYFSDVSQHTSIGEITDAVVLLTYCFGAYALEQYDVGQNELFARRRMLRDLLDQWLAHPGIGPNQRSGLLQMRGYLELTPAEADLEPDLARAFELWHKMLDCAVDAPLYPIEDFADNLSRMVGYLGEVDTLLALASRVDELLAKRAGGATAGEKAIDRAFSLLERGEPAAAIRELHKAKVKWFSGERLRGMLHVLLLLAEQYGRLGLAYAAKNHSMAAAFIARYGDPELVGDMLLRALLDVAEAEDAAGNSLGFLQLLPVILAEHVTQDPQPLDMNEHPRLQETIGQLAALLGFLERGNPQARKCLDELPADWPPEIKGPIWNAASQSSGFWTNGSLNEVWASAEEAMLDRPFGDLGPTRHIYWSALGIDCRCQFANDYVITPSAEQVIAELQLVACALAGRDLGIVPCEIMIKFLGNAEAKKLEFAIREQCGCEITVSLPMADRSSEDAVDTIALFGAVLHCCSALGEEALIHTFDQAVFEPIFIGRPYAELYREFVPVELFAPKVRATATAFEPERGFHSSAGERIPWFDGPGPTYDEAEARIDITHRYRRVGVSLLHTLEGVKADQQLMTRLRTLHDKGLKDWEILSILSNIAINQRLSTQSDPSPEQVRELGLQLIDRPEAPEDALSPQLFTDEQLELHAHMYLCAFLNGRQLRAPSCLKPEGLEKFLVVRYRIREDDVEHSDIFDWSHDADANS